MEKTTVLSGTARFAVDMIALAALTFLLLVGGAQSGIVTPTFTWVTGVFVFVGICSGFVFWTYSIENGPGLTRPRLWGYPLALVVLGIIAGGILWVTFVPAGYSSDLIYGVITLFWTAYALSCVGRF